MMGDQFTKAVVAKGGEFLITLPGDGTARVVIDKLSWGACLQVVGCVFVAIGLMMVATVIASKIGLID